MLPGNLMPMQLPTSILKRCNPCIRASCRHRLGLLSLLAGLALTTIPNVLFAQVGITHVYSAQLVRPAGVNPMKPMLADVLDKFPEAEVSLERENDVLHITTDQDVSPAELIALLAPYNIHLASLLVDGKPADPPTTGDKAFPWLSDLPEGTDMGPEEIADRKAAWVKAHPEAYRQWLNRSIQSTVRP